VRADYERALRLDPNNVEVRLEYGEALRRFGDPSGAAEQYREALRYNDLLAADEVKRLPRQRVEQVNRAIEELSRSG
jgi:cytochrome c-type biogenesis protein CcmH/NrfG